MAKITDTNKAAHDKVLKSLSRAVVKSHLRQRSAQELKEARVAAYEYLIP